MKIVHLGHIDKAEVRVDGARNVFRQVPISKDDGSPNFSFRVFTIDPQGHTPYHRHPFEHINYVIAGSGALISEDGTGRPVKQGDFALILPDEKHQYRNTDSEKPLVMICAVPVQYE